MRRLPLPVAAVAVGSMGRPDAVLFAPFLPPYDAAHSWWGVVTIDLAVSLGCSRCGVVPRPPGLDAGSRRPPGDGCPRRGTGGRPSPSATSVPVPRRLRARESVTHVVWDGFTHESGFVVRAWPALRDATVGTYPLPFLLQDASSVLGLLALLVAAVVWWRRAEARAVRPLGRVEFAVPVVALVGVVGAALVVGVRVVLAGGGCDGRRHGAGLRVPTLVAVALVGGRWSSSTNHRWTGRGTEREAR